MTRAYYTDSYTLQFETRVTAAETPDGRPAVLLDPVYFYPTSGGQPHDTGHLRRGDAVARVVDVIERESDGAILHILDRALTPGPATVVESVAVSFDGAIADDPSAAVQRLSIRDGWTLPAGKPFTQQAWDDAKTQSLRLLAARRYPLGRIAASRAEIDPERHAARLSVTLASGPAFRLGTMRVDLDDLPTFLAAPAYFGDVITHEMGHCVCFHHTDFYNRSISCGGGPSDDGD